MNEEEEMLNFVLIIAGEGDKKADAGAGSTQSFQFVSTCFSV